MSSEVRTAATDEQEATFKSLEEVRERFFPSRMQVNSPTKQGADMARAVVAEVLARHPNLKATRAGR